MSTQTSFEGFIYRIFCCDPEISACYIGSTKNIKRRMGEHKKNTNLPSSKEHKKCLYETIRNTGGWNNWNYQILATTRVNNYTELRKFEALYIKSTKHTLNQVIPCRTRKEHYKDEKVRISTYKKNYHQKNREAILQKRRDKYQENKEFNRLRSLNHYHMNKNKINQRRKMKRIWFNGVQTTVASNIFRHLKSKSHKRDMGIFTETLRDHLVSKFPRLTHMD